MQKLSRSLIAIGGLAALAACGDDVSIAAPTPPAVAVVGVTVSPSNLTLRVNETAQLGVSVETTGGAATTVTWNVTPASGVASVSATGLVTAVGAGSATVRATSTADASKSGVAQVIVQANAVRSVTVSPQVLSLQVGQTATAVATVDRDAGVAGTVRWSTNAVTVASVDSTTGRITAVAAGTAIIAATSTADASKSAALAVTVVPVPNNLIGLSVAPTNANLGVGSTVQLVPSATTSGSPTVTYRYRSSNVTVASVDSVTGLVTAVGNGTAVITTTATTSTNSLSVATTINVASASVSILSITTGALNTPVNIANVAGQIEVTMNISAGNQTLDSVRVRLGNQSAATQGFTVNGAPNAPVTLSINTAAYAINADSSSTVRYLNGQTGVTADLFVRGASGPTASNTITINLNNLDTFHARWSLPANPALSAGGFVWYGGPNTFTRINAIPVMYSGNVVTSATLHMDDFSVAGNAALCLVNGTTTGATTVTDAVAPFTGDFSCLNTTNTTVQPGVAASLRADGNAGPAGVGGNAAAGFHATLFANTGPLVQSNAIPVRIDVAGPVLAAAPALNFGLVSGQIVGWVNATTSLGSTATGGPFNTANVTDAGVGLNATRTLAGQYTGCPYATPVTATVWVAYDGTGNTIPECAVDFTGGATPGPYVARATETDRLGNLGTSPISGRFGVDKTNPTVRWGAASSADLTVDVATRFFQSEALDERAGFQQAVAHSHFLARASAATPTGVCAVGTTPTAGIGTAFVTAPACVRVTDVGPYVVIGGGYNQAPLVTINTAGYATYNSAWTDQAGNQTVLGARIVAVDPTLPVVSSLGLPGSYTSATFPAITMPYADDVEGIGYSFGMSYPAVGVLRYSRKTVNTTFDDVISTPGSITFASPFSSAPAFVRRIEIVDGASAVQLGAVTDPTAKPDGVQGTAFDVLGSASAPFSSTPFQAIPALNVQNGVNFQTFNTANPVNLVTTWSIIPLSAGFNAGAGLKAQVVTNSNSTNAPFARVDFYRAVGGEWYYHGSTSSAIPANNTTNRFWTYLFSGTPANDPFQLTAQAGAAAGNVFIAVGVTAAGDGLSTISTALVP